MSGVININDLLDDHVQLDVECLDRFYLNGYVPTLQVGGEVVRFLSGHLGNPIPSPALLERIGQRFRTAVGRFAERNQIPVVRFKQGERKIDRMHLFHARARPCVAGRHPLELLGDTDGHDAGIEDLEVQADDPALRPVERELRHKHRRANWKWLRRRYRPGWQPTDGTVTLLNPMSIAVTRYGYGGAQTPTPCTRAEAPSA